MQLRYYQSEAVESLFDFYAQPRKLDKDGKPERKNPLICLPTGTGKSLVIAEFLRRAFELVPATRAVMSTHVKELIKQNAAKLLDAWPVAPLGIYSAGLNKADYIQPIIFGGVRSMVGKFPKFGHRDFLVIDEAHLLGDDGSYLQFINELLKTNPFLKVIGLSATPYRLGMGCLTNGSIFTDIVYDLCNIEGFNRLIAEGYVCPLIPPSRMPDGTPLVEIDTTGVNIGRGDFAQADLAAKIKAQGITVKALTQAVALGANRQSWSIFAQSVEQAEEIGELLNGHFGIDTVVLHSKKSDKENAQALATWKACEVRAAVSMGMLTTGIDHPPLDFIACLRPTISTGLWVQMLGRGTRPFPGKPNCLVADFAGNTKRLGPINDPVLPKQRVKGTGEAPVRICPKCSCYNHASARVCFACGEAFTFETKITANASSAELLKSDLPIVEMIDVSRVVYAPHTSRAGNNMIKVAYYCNKPLPRTFYEYVSVEGFQGRIRGRDWFRQRCGEPPDTDAEVLRRVSELRAPKQIRVWMNANPKPKVLAAEF